MPRGIDVGIDPDRSQGRFAAQRVVHPFVGRLLAVAFKPGHGVLVGEFAQCPEHFGAQAHTIGQGQASAQPQRNRLGLFFALRGAHDGRGHPVKEGVRFLGDRPQRAAHALKGVHDGICRIDGQFFNRRRHKRHHGGAPFKILETRMERARQMMETVCLYVEGKTMKRQEFKPFISGRPGAVLCRLDVFAGGVVLGVMLDDCAVEMFLNEIDQFFPLLKAFEQRHVHAQCIEWKRLEFSGLFKFEKCSLVVFELQTRPGVFEGSFGAPCGAHLKLVAPCVGRHQKFKPPVAQRDVVRQNDGGHIGRRVSVYRHKELNGAIGILKVSVETQRGFHAPHQRFILIGRIGGHLQERGHGVVVLPQRGQKMVTSPGQIAGYLGRVHRAQVLNGYFGGMHALRQERDELTRQGRPRGRVVRGIRPAFEHACVGRALARVVISPVELIKPESALHRRKRPDGLFTRPGFAERHASQPCQTRRPPRVLARHHLEYPRQISGIVTGVVHRGKPRMRHRRRDLFEHRHRFVGIAKRVQTQVRQHHAMRSPRLLIVGHLHHLRFEFDRALRIPHIQKRFNRPSCHPIFVVYALEALAVIKTLAFMLPNKPIEHRRTVKKRPAEFGILDDLRHLGVCLRRLRNPCKLFAEPRKFEPDIRIRAVSLCRQRQTFTRPGLIAMRHLYRARQIVQHRPFRRSPQHLRQRTRKPFCTRQQSRIRPLRQTDPQPRIKRRHAMRVDPKRPIDPRHGQPQILRHNPIQIGQRQTHRKPIIQVLDEFVFAFQTGNRLAPQSQLEQQTVRRFKPPHTFGRQLAGQFEVAQNRLLRRIVVVIGIRRIQQQPRRHHSVLLKNRTRLSPVDFRRFLALCRLCPKPCPDVLNIPRHDCSTKTGPPKPVSSSRVLRAGRGLSALTADTPRASAYCLAGNTALFNDSVPRDVRS